MRAEEGLGTVRKLMKEGALREARRHIEDLARRRKLTGQERLLLAHYANECRFSVKAAQILYPLIHRKGTRELSGTDAQKIEYARALIGVGAVNEARGILGTIVDQKVLARAYGLVAVVHFQAWDWVTPLPILRRAFRTFTDSDRLLISAVLGASLVHGPGEMGEARRILEEMARQTSLEFFPRSHWDAFQLLGQSYYLEGKLKLASTYFERASKLNLDRPGDSYWRMLERFRVLIELHDPARAKAAAARLAVLKETFPKTGSSVAEFARSCDYYQAIALRDRKLLERVYFGSPYDGIRKKLLKAFDLTEAELPPCYEYRIGTVGPGPALFLDVTDGSTNARTPLPLKRGQLAHRLLKALCADFYRPPTVTELHKRLYPDEHFNPFKPSERVKQAIWQLRGLLKRARFPLEVVEEGGRYLLRSPVNLSLRVERGGIAGTERYNPKLQELLLEAGRRFPTEPFRAGQIQNVLGISRATAVALLKDGAERGLIVSLGNGPQTRYRLVGEP